LQRQKDPEKKKTASLTYLLNVFTLKFLLAPAILARF
jgi:hypothetical protein